MEPPKEKGVEKVPALDELVARGNEKFASKRFHTITGGKVQPYFAWDATNELLGELGIDPFDISKIVLSQTSVKPETLNVSVEGANWGVFLQDLAAQIIAQEMKNRNPEIDEEERKRSKEFDEKASEENIGN